MSTVALVVGNSGALTAGDTIIQGRLTGLGHTVTVVDDGASAELTKDFVVIAESVSSANVTTKYATTTCGVLTMEAGLNLDNDLATADGTTATGLTDVDLIDPGGVYTALLGGLGTGTVTVATGGGYIPAGNPAAEIPNGNANRVAATSPSTTRRVLWPYDTGDTMENSHGAAEGRRVFFGIGDDATYANLNANGLALLDAAITWVAPQPVVADDANAFQTGAFQDGAFQLPELNAFQQDAFQDGAFQLPLYPNLNVTVYTELASGQSEILWDPYELDTEDIDADTLGTATMAALQPTVIAVDGGGGPSVIADAELVETTWAAYDAAAQVQPNAGNAAVTGAALQPSAQVQPNSGIATATGAANAPTPSVQPGAGNAAVTGAANAPGISVAGGAGAGTVTGQANAPTSSLAPSAGNAAETLAANAPAASVQPNAGIGTVTGAANQPSVAIVVNTDAAPLIFAALDPTVFTGSFVTADAENVAVAIAAYDASAQVAGSAGAATVTGSASSPAASLAVNGEVVTVIFGALDPTVIISGDTTAAAEAVGVTFAALDPTVQTSSSGDGHPPKGRPSGLTVTNVRRRKPVPPEPVPAQHVIAHAGLARMGIAAHGASTSWNDDDTAIALLLGVLP